MGMPKMETAGMTLLHLPEVQSTPALLGTQNPPAACFSRQQPGVTMLFTLTQYCVLEQPVDVPVQGVHSGRSSATNSAPPMDCVEKR